MARLLDGFSGLFAFGLALDAALAAGRPLPSPDAVRQDALERIEVARTAAEAAGASARQTESACFAVVAWLDEILARLPGAGDAGGSLQASLFNSTNAHSEFFHHLSALSTEDGEVREVYWHALAHGFKGQYYFESGDDGELGKLKTLHGRQLPVPPLELATLAQAHLTPQPYATRDPRGPRQPQRRERALVQAGIALALILPCAHLLWWWSGRLPPRDAPPAVSAAAQRITQQLQSYACADLAATTGADGVMEVRGFVPTRADLARVQADVGALPATRAARFDLRLRAWPHCEVAAILKPYQARNRDGKPGLHIAASTARDDRLREGDTVRFQIGGLPFDSHVRVDYYTSEGAVLHLTPAGRPMRLLAGRTIELGGDMPASWLVSPPFGTVLVAAIASPDPFDESAERPPFELASAYLSHLRESLAANKGGERLVADFLFLETVAR